MLDGSGKKRQDGGDGVRGGPDRVDEHGEVCEPFAARGGRGVGVIKAVTFVPVFGGVMH